MEEELKVLKSNALDAYTKASKEGKELLSNLLGKKNFIIDIKERVQGFLDACEVNGTDPVDPKFTSGTPSGNALEMLAEIAKALNGGKVMTSKDKRYYPYFIYDPGFRFCDVVYDITDSDSFGGPRLCVLDENLAKYFGTQFIGLFDKFLNP